MLNKSTDILPVREQYALRDQWLAKRIKTLVPMLMKECAVDLWIVFCSEYNEDPLFRSLAPARVQYVSRTGCLLFSLKNGVFEAISCCRPNGAYRPFYRQAYDPKTQTQIEAIARVIEEKDPQAIAVNVSDAGGITDGLSKSRFGKLQQALGGRPLITDSPLAMRVCETRLDEELTMYRHIYEIACRIQQEAYSPQVIRPGVTTTADVEYFILQRISDMGLSAWFTPDVDVQREDGPAARLSDTVIQKGDLLHTDMGITYMGLCTDSQKLAYVLKDGEETAPAGLLAGMKQGNRFQDLVREEMLEGRTGNQIFEASVKRAREEGLRPMLYTHPIGVFGHSAGPNFGLYDQQSSSLACGMPVLHDHTCYALELNVLEKVPEWNKDVWFYIEETILFAGGKAEFFDPEGRKEIRLIRCE